MGLNSWTGLCNTLIISSSAITARELRLAFGTPDLERIHACPEKESIAAYVGTSSPQDEHLRAWSRTRWFLATLLLSSRVSSLLLLAVLVTHPPCHVAPNPGLRRRPGARGKLSDTSLADRSCRLPRPSCCRSRRRWPYYLCPLFLVWRRRCAHIIHGTLPVSPFFVLWRRRCATGILHGLVVVFAREDGQQTDTILLAGSGSQRQVARSLRVGARDREWRHQTWVVCSYLRFLTRSFSQVTVCSTGASSCIGNSTFERTTAETEGRQQQ